jgi:cytochrome c oxidase subunit I+III
MVVFVVNLARSWRGGTLAGANPWDADTLEWATSSPPPHYNFADTLVVQSRAGLWAYDQDVPVVTGLATRTPEVLVTTVMDAEPVLRHTHPNPTVAPLAMAIVISAMLIWGIFTPWAYPIGIAALAVPFAMWAWPRTSAPAHREALEATYTMRAPV